MLSLLSDLKPEMCCRFGLQRAASTLTLSRNSTSFSQAVSVQWNALVLRDGIRMSIELDLPTVFSPYFKLRIGYFFVPTDSLLRYQLDDRRRSRSARGLEDGSRMNGVSNHTRLLRYGAWVGGIPNAPNANFLPQTKSKYFWIEHLPHFIVCMLLFLSRSISSRMRLFVSAIGLSMVYVCAKNLVEMSSDRNLKKNWIEPICICIEMSTLLLRRTRQVETAVAVFVSIHLYFIFKLTSNVIQNYLFMSVFLLE